MAEIVISQRGGGGVEVGIRATVNVRRFTVAMLTFLNMKITMSFMFTSDRAFV